MIRRYKDRDKKELLALLKLNIPQYFASSEESDFVEYLDNYVEDYFVVEDGGSIIGSGGLNYFPDDAIARISWDIIHPDHQGKGIGRQLVQHRLELLQNNPEVNTAVVRTTQLVYRFYEKMGFMLVKTKKDFWAKGFDLYQMHMYLK